MIGTEVVSEFLINSEESKVVIVSLFFCQVFKSKMKTNFKNPFIQFVLYSSFLKN